MTLAYREFGSGQPLVILHGLFGQSDNWNTLAKRFSEQGFRVFTVDQRNHGLSPHSSEWSYELMAKDLKEFIDSHQLQNPILLGHSMGGKTVLFFDMLFPRISKKSIIVDIAPRSYNPHHQTVLQALNAVNFSTLSTRKEAEAILNVYINDFGTKQFLLKNIFWKDNDNKQMAWRFNLETITKQIENIGIEMPKGICESDALFIRGGNSDYITDKDIDDISARFNHFELITIENSGHWVHAEKPEDFFNCVMNFIS